MGQPGSDQELEGMLRSRWDNQQVSFQDHVGQYEDIFDKIRTEALGKKEPKRIAHRRWMTVIKVAATLSLLLVVAYFMLRLLAEGTPNPVADESPGYQYFERSTTVGEKLILTLPDQTKVVLNSLSSIRFTSDFGKEERLVQLTGEAFFEVSPDSKNSFIVKTGPVTTTALGTAFNSYSREGEIQISLTEGKVLVLHETQEVNLNPGEMAAVKDSIEVGTFDKALVTAWKEGKITFRRKSIGEVMASLERWYGVTIELESEVNKNRTVTGTFNNESLEDILIGLSFSMDLKYKINGKNVHIQQK